MRKIRREVARKIQKSFEPRIRPRQGYGVTGSADVTDWNDRQKDRETNEAKRTTLISRIYTG
jgi:hypothetical protein